MGQYSHKPKLEFLNKAVKHLDALEPLFQQLEAKQMERMAKCLTGEGSGEFSDVAEHWIGATSKEVIRHFPPLVLLGPPVAPGSEREIYCYDADPLVRVQLFEVDHEYAYSAPTGLFNLAVPHLGRRFAYSTETYEAWCRKQ
jgi:hypothetical protein